MTTSEETIERPEALPDVDDTEPTSPERRWPRWQSFAVLALYLAWWIYIARPLFGDLNGNLWGGVGDQTGFLSLYRELHQDGELGILPGTVGDFSAPEGLRYGWINLFGQAPSSLLVSGLFVVFSPLAAVSVYATIALVGTAFATFLLTRKLTGSPLAAVVAGFGFGFAPFLVIKSAGHLDFSHGWVFVVMLWRWLELIEHRTVRNAIFAGLASLLAVAWTAYFALLALVLGSVLAFAFIVRELRARGLSGARRSIALVAITAVAPVFFIALTLVLAGSDPDAVKQPVRSIEELTVFAGRPLDYLIPTRGTPIVGDWAGDWRAAHMHGSNESENTLYLGWTMLILAFIGTVTLIRARSTRFLGAVLVGVALVAAWVSLPPLVAVGGALIPTPSKFLFEVQPGFRVYSRFVILVLLAVAVLAAFGARTLIGAVRNPKAQLAAAVVCAVLVVADLEYRIVPNPVGSLPSYETLREQPPGIAAELPMMPAAQDLSQATFYQQRHRHRILNGYREGSEQEERAISLNDLSSAATLSGLRAIGVKYLLVRQDTKIVGWPEVPTPRAQDVTLLQSDPAMKLYRLNPGFGALARWYGGLNAEEVGPSGKPFRWSSAAESELNLDTNCTTCTTGTVSFTVMPFGAPRTLTFSGAGLTNVKKTAAAGEQTITLPVQLKGGRATVDVAISPGPTPIRDVVAGSPDPRSFSVALGNPSLKVDR